MKLRRVYRFKLEPNAEQKSGLYRLSGSRRFVYNLASARRQEHFKATGKTLSAKDLSLELTALKKQEATAWLSRPADSQLLQQSLKDLDKAFQGFFAKRARFPKFRSRNKGHFAFRIPQRVRVQSDKVYCPKIGWIRIRQSQEIDGRNQKRDRSERDACSNWFVTLTSELEMRDTALAAPQNSVSMGCRIEGFYVFFVEWAKLHQRHDCSANWERNWHKAQRVLAREQSGQSSARCRQTQSRQSASQNRELPLADFVHKISSDLVQRFDFIGLEDLNVKGLRKTRVSLNAFTMPRWANCAANSNTNAFGTVDIC